MSEFKLPNDEREVLGKPIASTGIAKLQIRKRAPSEAAPEPHDENFHDGARKGGKGGEGGRPPSPPSNATFLESLMRNVPDDARPAVCAKLGDPTEGDWRASVAGDVDRQCPADRNGYFNYSSFNLEPDGSIRARKDRCELLPAPRTRG